MYAEGGFAVTARTAPGVGRWGGRISAACIGNRVASFTNLAISGTAGDRTLSFSATGFVSVTSGPVSVTAGSATQLTLTTQPSATAQSGVEIGRASCRERV